MGYLYLMSTLHISLVKDLPLLTGQIVGVIISSAVLPASLTLMWKKQNAIAATLSPVLGLACSLIAWLVTAQKESGNLSVASTGSKYVNFPPLPGSSSPPWPPIPLSMLTIQLSSNPMLAGNVVALLSPIIFIPVLTYAFGPQNYDYKSMALIRLGDDADIAEAEHVDVESIPHHVAGLTPEEVAKEQAKLSRASLIAKTLTGVMTLALLILWPMPMYGSGYIFSKPFFTGWVSIGILWLFFSAACVGIYPLWEGRHSMAHTFGGIAKDLMGRGRTKRRVGETQVMEGVDGSENGSGTPVEVMGTGEKGEKM